MPTWEKRALQLLDSIEKTAAVDRFDRSTAELLAQLGAGIDNDVAELRKLIRMLPEDARNIRVRR
jgi:hypothetical protein